MYMHNTNLLIIHLLLHAGSMIIYLELNYIYILGFLCVAVLVIVPLVAFPVVVSALN